MPRGPAGGAPLRRDDISDVVVDRLWQKVMVPRRPNGTVNHAACWPWTGAGARSGGYGRIAVPGRGLTLVHRIVFVLVVADITSVGVVIRHSCGTKLCCNGRHLRSGSQADAVHDWRATLPPKPATAPKPAPVRVSRYKLSPEQVTEAVRLRAAGATIKALAGRYSVAESTAWQYVNADRRVQAG